MCQNDHLFISHYHDSEDGFSNVEEDSEWIEDDRASLDSVVRPSATRSKHWTSLFSQRVELDPMFNTIRMLTEKVGRTVVGRAEQEGHCYC